MNTPTALTKPRVNNGRLVWAAVGLALLAALGYVLVALHVLGIGEFSQDEGPAGIVQAAAGCYVAGGLLILLRRRWLWVIGAFINAMVVIFFFNLYKDRPSVMFSPGGLTTKIAQLLLEAVLLYLIFRYTAGRTKK